MPLHMEIPTISKVVLDNLLASMGSPATFKEGAPEMKQNNGFKQLPVSLFHGASLPPPATAIPSRSPTLQPLPGGAHMRDLATSPSHLFNECADSFAKEGSVLPPVKEKPKRVRKSRAGALSNKRGTSDTVLAMNLEGAQQIQLPPPKRRRPSTKVPIDGESVEKPPPRKRNRSKAKAKEEQSLSFSAKENSLGHSDPMSSKGILGMYGLEPKSLDLSRYMKDTSVESLMAGDFNMPSFSGKQGPASSHITDNSFGSHVSSVLQSLTRPLNTDQARQGSLFLQPTQRKPIKFSLDLESSPIDGSEESLGIGLYEPKIKAMHKELSTPFLQSRKAPEPPSLFNLETIAVTPPADFWSALQIPSNLSLSSLIAQASTTTDSRFFPSEAGSNVDKFSMPPPSIFSYGSSQIPPESSGDRLVSSKLNQWYRAEPPKWESTEIQPQHSVAFPGKSMFPFKLDIESDPPTKPSETCGLKDGLFDIDLNKQSPEAEAAESVAHSTSSNLCEPQVTNEVPAIVQVNVCDTDKEPPSVQTSECVNAPTPVDEVDGVCNIKSLPVRQDLDHVLETHVTLQHEDVKAERPSEETVSAIVDKQHSNEAVKDVPINAISSLPALFVPEVPETQEMCSTDVPYSPGMHATAHILCKMANSSSPFYFERDDKHVQVMECDNDAYIQHPSKAARVACLDDEEARTHEHTVVHESWNEKYMIKAHSKDGKDKLFNHMGSSNGPNAEPWASTPPRHAPKNVSSRMSGSHSSESDRSPCHGPKEHGSRRDLGNTIKVQRDHLGVAASCKVSSLFTRKDPKGNPKPAPKTTFLHTLPTKGLLVTSQKKTKPQSLAAYGDGLAKVSRPRSNTSKNCLQSQRSTNSYPVQNGCSLKSPASRHVLPYVGEVRHGSK